VQQTEIVPGDTLQIGPVIFVVQVDGYPADEDLQPVTAAATAADTATGGAAAAAGKSDEEAEVLDLEAEGSGGSGGSKTEGEFDPMEALESAEGSAFDFQIDESQAGAESPVDLEESGH
jgi:predicted component of type VI protein secretion system